MNRRTFAVTLTGAVAAAVTARTAASASPAPASGGEAAWLRQYAGSDGEALNLDSRFRPLLHSLFHGIRCPFLARRVHVTRILPRCIQVGCEIGFVQDRYAVLTGFPWAYPDLRCLLWIDTQDAGSSRPPLAIATFLVPQPTGQRGARYNLWVLSRRAPGEFQSSGLPRNFKVHFRRWLRQGSAVCEGRVVKLQWLTQSLHIHPVQPSLFHIPRARLHPPAWHLAS